MDYLVFTPNNDACTHTYEPRATHVRFASARLQTLKQSFLQLRSCDPDVLSVVRETVAERTSRSRHITW